MLRIRLQRIGRNREPVFRIVVTDQRNGPKSGRFIESLGTYDARKDDNEVDRERAAHWISQGALPSDTIHNFLVTKGVIEGKKRNVLPQKSPVKKEGGEEAAAEAPATPKEAPAEEATPEEVPAESTPEEAPAVEAPAEPAEEKAE